MNKPNGVLNVPNPTCKARFHSGSNAESLMNSAEVVMNSIQGNRMTKVFNLLSEPVRQPGKSAHRHSHGQVRAFPVPKGRGIRERGIAEMTNDETNEILLLLLRSLRSQWEALADIGPQVQAIYDYLKSRDQKFEGAVAKFESASKAEVSLPVGLSIQTLDDIIRKLEAGRKPPRVN